MPISRSSANRSLARFKSTTSWGGLATMYGLPSSTAWAIRRRQSSRTRSCSAPSDVIQPWSAIMLTTLRPASASARFSSAKLAPLLEVGRDLVVPGLDRLVAGLAGDLDLLQQGRRPDRAGVEAVNKFAHGRSLSSRPVVNSREFDRSRSRQGSSMRCS